MQNYQENLNLTNLHSEDLTQYELTKDVLLRLHEYNLTPTAKLVLLYLTSCYNPKNSLCVFPKVETISETLGTGLTATKKAIKDLILAGLILKSKRKKAGNNNKYLLTNAIIKRPIKRSKVELLNSRKTTVSCNEQKREQIKEQQHVVASFKNSTRMTHYVTMEEIPAQIIADKKIINKQGYWAVLPKEAREELRQEEAKYLEKQEKLKKKREKQRKNEELRQQKEAEENNIPFEEYWTLEKALPYIKHHKNMFGSKGKTSVNVPELLALHNLDYDLI